MMQYIHMCVYYEHSMHDGNYIFNVVFLDKSSNEKSNNNVNNKINNNNIYNNKHIYREKIVFFTSFCL